MKKQPQSIRSAVSLLLVLLLLTACGGRPSNVLSDKKMEALLYDLYIAEGQTSVEYELFSSDSIRKRKLLDSVLEKHKINKETLDASLEWYATHLEAYDKINSKIITKFSEQLVPLREEQQIAEADRLKASIILPHEKEKQHLLNTLTLPSGIYSFESDTTMFRYGSKYGIELFLFGLDESITPELTLCVQAIDTTIVTKLNIVNNGLMVTEIQLPASRRFRKVYGNIRFNGLTPSSAVFLSSFVLYTTEEKDQLPSSARRSAR